jgi:heme-degrading monooxygenase HmoA
MLATLSDVQVAVNDFDEYVRMRRDHINPELRNQPGFIGTDLLRARDSSVDGEVTLALFNYWADDESRAAWATAPAHDEVSKFVIPLVRRIMSRGYVREDAASTTSSGPASAMVGRISIQDVVADRVQEYLDYRRTVIHPSMAAAPGFVSAEVFRDLEQANRFAISFRWESDEAGEAYFHMPFHLGEITDRVRELLSNRLSTNRYDVVRTD